MKTMLGINHPTLLYTKDEHDIRYFLNVPVVPRPDGRGGTLPWSGRRSWRAKGYDALCSKDR